MEKLFNSLDSLLGRLPFNGDKTIIGTTLQVFLPVLVAKFPFFISYSTRP